MGMPMVFFMGLIACGSFYETHLPLIIIYFVPLHQCQKNNNLNNMRKFTLLFAAALLLCTATMAKTVTPAQARAIAAGYVNLASLTDAAHTIKVKAASGAMADIYLFNDAKGKGFVLIPGDDCVGNVLGYSHQGSIDTNDMPPALSEWLSTVATHIAAARTSDLPVVSADPVDIKGEIQPLLTTEWDQKAPYHDMTPTQSGKHTKTGCFQTAAAQIMKYHEWPVTGRGTVTHPVPNCDQKSVTYDLTQSTYDWKNMLDVYKDGNYTTTEGNAVALLMRDLGAVMHVEYDTTGTGALEADAHNAYNEYFGYNCHLYYHDQMAGSAWLDTLLNELRNSRPVLVCGNLSSGLGHAFVADGYDADGYLHINWGWSGKSNGYFRMGCLGKGSYIFTYNQCMLTFTPDHSGSAFVEQQNRLSSDDIIVYDASQQKQQEYTVSLSQPSSDKAVSLLSEFNYHSTDFEHCFKGKVRLALYDAESGEYVTTLGNEQTSTIVNEAPDFMRFDQLLVDLSSQTLAALPDGNYRVKVESCNTRRDGNYFDEWVQATFSQTDYSSALLKSADKATFYYIDELNGTDVKATITPSASDVMLDDVLPTTIRLEQNSPKSFEGVVIFNSTDMETGAETAFACTDTLSIFPGEIAKARFDLPISSTYFQAGHRYRITLSGLTISDEIVTPLAVADAPVIYVGDMTGISSATTDTDATAAPEYYDLSGRRILKPTSGVTIVRQGKKAGRKVVEK